MVVVADTCECLYECFCVCEFSGGEGRGGTASAIPAFSQTLLAECSTFLPNLMSVLIQRATIRREPE